VSGALQSRQQLRVKRYNTQKHCNTARASTVLLLELQSPHKPPLKQSPNAPSKPPTSGRTRCSDGARSSVGWAAGAHATWVLNVASIRFIGVPLIHPHLGHVSEVTCRCTIIGMMRAIFGVCSVTDRLDTFPASIGCGAMVAELVSALTACEMLATFDRCTLMW
jgi:hypothetical protein